MTLGARLTLIAIFIISPAIWAGDWHGHEQNLRGLEGAIRSLNSEISHKIQESSLTTDSSLKKTLMAEIVELERELQDEKEKMRSEVRHIKYGHPERGKDLRTLSADFNMNLPELLPATPQLERLLAESKSLLKRVYGTVTDSFRGLASEAVAESDEATLPRWVLEK